MSNQYLLTCSCGEELTVEPRHAGQTRRCEACGRQLEIPRLREMRELPQAAVSDEREVKRNWSVGQGLLFSFSVPVILISLGLLGKAAYEKSRLVTERPPLDFVLKYSRDPVTRVEIEKANYTESWEYWKVLRKLGTDRPGKPVHVLNRQAASRWQLQMISAGVVAALASLCAIATLLIRRMA